MSITFSGLRYAVGALPNKDASEWRWFLVGIDSLLQRQCVNVSVEHYSSEELAFGAGRAALNGLRTTTTQPEQQPPSLSKLAHAAEMLLHERLLSKGGKQPSPKAVQLAAMARKAQHAKG